MSSRTIAIWRPLRVVVSQNLVVTSANFFAPSLLNRSVTPLSKLSGQEYRFLYPVDGSDSDGKVRYQVSQPLTMNRAPYVEEIPLPAGTYYLEYEVVDVFMRSTIMDRIEFKWDGENMTLSQDDAWMD